MTMRNFILFVTVLTLLVVGCSSTGKLTKDNAEDQYATAQDLYERGKYYQAAEAFRLIVFNYSGVSFIDSVQYYLGMCYYNDEDYILAVAEFRRLTRNFPHSSLADDGQLMIGKCYYLSAPKNCLQSAMRESLKRHSRVASSITRWACIRLRESISRVSSPISSPPSGEAARCMSLPGWIGKRRNTRTLKPS